MAFKEKITKEDLLGIRIGRSETFSMASRDRCRSAQSYAGQLKDSVPFPKFITSINRPADGEVLWSITVTRLA